MKIMFNFLFIAPVFETTITFLIFKRKMINLASLEGNDPTEYDIENILERKGIKFE